MKIELVEITPDFASELLKNNPNNRRTKRKHLDLLCREIASGRWVVNGDAIRVAKDGTLLDGQHRLEAVQRTGIAIKSLVIYGLDKSVFSTIDSGALRSGCDALNVAGELNGKNLASALVLVDVILSGSDFNNQIKVSNPEILEMLKAHPNIKASGKWVHSLQRIAPGSVSMALHYLFSTVDAHAADRFFHSVATGENLEAGNPAFALRNRLIENATSKAKLKRRYIVALFIKAWNHYIAGEKIRYLRYRESGDSPEPFPSISGTRQSLSFQFHENTRFGD